MELSFFDNGKKLSSFASTLKQLVWNIDDVWWKLKVRFVSFLRCLSNAINEMLK